MKVKYEGRLAVMKKEFEQKFKKNEVTWKKRMDYHKQVLTKEQMKINEMDSIIRDLISKTQYLET